MSPMKTTTANFLVTATLDRLLSQTASRLDAGARLQRIHAAALIECALCGHAQMKIAAVASRAQVSTASIYESYEDRDTLLVASMETLFAILAADVIEIPADPDPQVRVEKLLIAHGEVYAQPIWPWVFRLHSVLVWSGRHQLRDIGQAVFHGIDRFWTGFLQQLVDEGHLVSCDPAEIVPHLLGPMERCTIIARLSYSEHPADQLAIADVAKHSSDVLFRLWGRRSEGLVKSTAPRPPIATSAGPAAARIDPLAVRLSRDIERGKTPGTPNAARDRLLLAAGVVCQEFGYHDATLRQVATHAKISTATVYKCFTDKADLFSSALEAELNQQLPFDVPQNDALSPQARLTYTLQTVTAHASYPCWAWMHHLIMASAISDTPRIVAVGADYVKAVETSIMPALEAFGVPRNSTKDLTLNSVLGPIERYGLLSLVLFGPQAVATDQLNKLASDAVANLVQLLANEPNQ
jgi:AcrR family transcriptional regulator